MKVWLLRLSPTCLPGPSDDALLTSVCCSAISILGVLRTHHLTGAERNADPFESGCPTAEAAAIFRPPETSHHSLPRFCHRAR